MRLLSFGFLVFLFISHCTVQAQSNSNAKVLESKVRAQFRDFNAQNWAAVRAGYADTMKVFLLNGKLIFKDADETVQMFKETQEKFPKSYSSIESLMTIGNKVIIKEKITGGSPNQPNEDVMIWEFQGDKVVRVWLVF